MFVLKAECVGQEEVEFPGKGLYHSGSFWGGNKRFWYGNIWLACCVV